MSIDETAIVPEVNFPVIPEEASEEMKKYFTEFETVLRGVLKGSLWLSTVFEDGKIGN